MYLLSITLESIVVPVQHREIHHLLGRTTLVIIRLLFILFSILVISLLTNHEARDQDPIVFMFSVHEFCEYVIEIFSIFTSDNIICDSVILDNNLHSI